MRTVVLGGMSKIRYCNFYTQNEMIFYVSERSLRFFAIRKTILVRRISVLDIWYSITPLCIVLVFLNFEITWMRDDCALHADTCSKLSPISRAINVVLFERFCVWVGWTLVKGGLLQSVCRIVSKMAAVFIPFHGNILRVKKLHIKINHDIECQTKEWQTWLAQIRQGNTD